MPPERADKSGINIPEISRAEIERRIQDAIARNRNAMGSIPEVADVEAFDRALAAALRSDGRPLDLKIREPDGQTKEQAEMYVMGRDGPYVQVTYFLDDGTLEESSFIDISQILFAGSSDKGSPT